jgi:hypothetical protein
MIVYFWARPTERLGTFWLWVAPGPASGLAEAIGLPTMPVWIVVALVVVGIAAAQDRDERRAALSRPGDAADAAGPGSRAL